MRHFGFINFPGQVLRAEKWSQKYTIHIVRPYPNVGNSLGRLIYFFDKSNVKLSGVVVSMKGSQNLYNHWHYVVKTWWISSLLIFLCLLPWHEITFSVNICCRRCKYVRLGQDDRMTLLAILKDNSSPFQTSQRVHTDITFYFAHCYACHYSTFKRHLIKLNSIELI